MRWIGSVRAVLAGLLLVAACQGLGGVGYSLQDQGPSAQHWPVLSPVLLPLAAEPSGILAQLGDGAVAALANGLAELLLLLQAPTVVGLSGWLRDHSAIVAAMGAVVLGLLFVAMGLRRRRAATKPAHGGDDDLAYIHHQYGISEPRRSGVVPSVKTGRGRIGDTIVAFNSSATPAVVCGWLQFLDAKSTRVPLGSTNIRIGRHADNDIVLENKTVHRHHAIIELTGEKRFALHDLGGTNGSYVNGQRCTRRELSHGDLVEFGEVRVRFYDSENALI